MVAHQKSKPRFTCTTVCAAPPQKKFKPKRLIDIPEDDANLRGQLRIKPPPDEVKTEFNWDCRLWMSIDVETHDLAPPSDRKWETGSFGHLRRALDITKVQALRIVQIGWAFGDFGADTQPITKTLLVRPDGFEITKAAAAIHGITTQHAAANGVELKEALAEVVADANRVVSKFGRLCAHNLEFDATIVEEEMSRSNFDADARANFFHAIQGGMCTMDPYLTKWCCEDHLRATDLYGDERDTLMHPVGLGNLVRVLDPDLQETCKPAHDAGADSRAAWLVLKELHRIVRGD